MQDLIEHIKACQPDFNTPAWALVSSGARNLVESLIVFDPERRLSPFKSLQHEWVCSHRNCPPVPDDDSGSNSIVQKNLNQNKRRLTKTLDPNSLPGHRMSFNRSIRLSAFNAPNLQQLQALINQSNDSQSEKTDHIDAKKIMSDSDELSD